MTPQTLLIVDGFQVRPISLLWLASISLVKSSLLGKLQCQALDAFSGLGLCQVTTQPKPTGSQLVQRLVP